MLNTREEITELLAGAELTAVQETALSRFYIVVAKPTAPATSARPDARSARRTMPGPPEPRPSTPERL